MRTVKAKRPLAGVAATIVAMVAGAPMVPRVVAECALSGGVSTAAGCTRMGGQPALGGCTSVTGGDCYSCQYQCPNGETQNCAEQADGGHQICWPADYDTGPQPLDQQQGSESPILIDLDSNGFHLDGLDRAVLFDLGGKGVPRYYSWTSAQGRDAFLCRDRNGNGRIESGQELFGNATPLAGGAQAPHGYAALRELDLLTQGGNQDGRLTAADWGFQELCAWVDEDHDGVSDAGEVLPLWQAGVIELSYEYHETRRRDVYGNEFRYQGSAVLANPQGKPRHAPTYDVFFLSREANAASAGR